MARDGKTYYYQTNYRGDVTTLTDSKGVDVAIYEYDAFGNLVKETGDIVNPYRYAGYRYDEGTGFYYLQSRYYDPGMGRFLTRDTFEGEDTDPLSLNKYAYTENSPILMVDPDGKRSRKYFAKRILKKIFRWLRWSPIRWIYSLYSYSRYQRALFRCWTFMFYYIYYHPHKSKWHYRYMYVRCAVSRIK